MMDCVYQFKDKTYESYMQARAAALTTIDAENSVTILYSGKPSKQINAVINNMAKLYADSKTNPEGAVRVTDLVYSGQEDVEETEVIKYRQAVGTAFHALMEEFIKLPLQVQLDIVGSEVRDGIEFTPKLQFHFDKLFTTLDKTPISDEYRDLKLPGKTAANEWKTAVRSMFKQLLKQLNININSSSHLFLSELPMATQIALTGKLAEQFPGISLVKGIADLVEFYTDDKGKLCVIIRDYKFHINPKNKSVNRAPMHSNYATQLELYKRILLKAFEGKLISKNIHVELINIDLIGTKTPEISVTSTKTVHQINHSVLTESMPISPKINMEASKTAAEKVQMALDTIFTRSHTKRWTKADYKKWVISQIGKGGPVLAYDENTGMASIAGYDMEVNLDQWVEKRLEYNDDVRQGYIDSVKNAINAQDPEFIIAKSRKQEDNNRLRNNLQKYFNGSGWIAQDNPYLEELGIISIYNNIQDIYDFISIVSMDTDLTSIRTMHMKDGYTILSDCLDRKDMNIDDYNNLPPSSFENIERAKVLLAIQLFNDTLPEGKNYVINDIKIINPYTGQQSLYFNKTPFTKAFNILSKSEKISPEKRGLFQPNHKVSYRSEALVLWDSIVPLLEANGISFDKNLFLHTTYKPELIQELKNLAAYIKNEYAEYMHDENLDDYATYKSNIYQTMYSQINALIGVISGFSFSNIIQASTYGITSETVFGNLKHMVLYGEAKQFARNGYAITGLLQGVDTATMYGNPDYAVNYTNMLISNWMAQARQQFLSNTDELNDATIEFLNSKENKAKRVISGNHFSAYKSLLKPNKDGTDISEDLVFKKLNDPSLTNSERKFLEVILWTFNRYRMSNKILSESSRAMTWKEFKKSGEYEQYIEEVNHGESTWRLMPLQRSRTAADIMNIAKDPFNNVKQKARKLWSNFEKLADPREFTQRQKTEQQKLESTFTMYNQFVSDNIEKRTNIITADGVDSFEFNLNQLGIDYIFAYIKEAYYNRGLDAIQTVVSCVLMAQDINGIDYSPTIKAINDRIKIGFFSKHLVDKDLKDALDVQSVLRSTTSLLKIAARPILFVKEMTVSTMKIMSKVGVGYFQNQKLKTADLMKGFGEVLQEGAMLSGKKLTGQLDVSKFNLVSNLNNFYGVANCDMNILAGKVAADRFGLMNLSQRMLYWTSTAADYYHRMAIFIACMIRDGCYDAHSLNEYGSLEYDMEKDARFEYFWRHRNNSNFKDQKFLEQKSLYLAMIAQFNKEGRNLKIEEDENGNKIYPKLPCAYTNIEKDSIKEAIGTVLGMYDHEESASFQKKGFAAFMIQFMTYIPGDIKKHFAIKKQSSTQGYWSFKRDEHGNKLYYGDKIDPITGEMEEVTDNEDGTRIPITIRYNNPVEGLFTSCLTGIASVWNPQARAKLMDGSIESKQRIANIKMFFINFLIVMLLGYLLLSIFGYEKEEDLPKHYALAYDILNKRVAQEFSPWQSIFEPIMGLGMVGVDTLDQLADTTLKLITNFDEKTQRKFINNLAAAKDITTLFDE